MEYYDTVNQSSKADRSVRALKEAFMAQSVKLSDDALLAQLVKSSGELYHGSCIRELPLSDQITISLNAIQDRLSHDGGIQSHPSFKDLVAALSALTSSELANTSTVAETIINAINKNPWKKFQPEP